MTSLDASPVTQDFALPALTLAPGQSVGGRSPADALLIAARGEAEAIRAAARAAGREEGLAAAADEVALAVAALREAAVAVTAIAAELPDVLEEQAVDLGFAVARQALAGALDVRPELVVDVVRGGLRRLVDRERVTLLVNPEDLECVRLAAPQLISELGGIEHCEVQAERRVARGGAMVRTAEGEIDATLETKLARAREVVAQALAEPDHGDGDAGADDADRFGA
jgi:flagellar assembly protein FliH